LESLCALKNAVETVTEKETPARDLLLVAFCRTLIKISNAAFDHQSMSFRDNRQCALNLAIEIHTLFEHDVEFVVSGAAYNPKGHGRVILGDSRNPSMCVQDTFDLVITSPPYVNRMSYIRELRPYMYWLGFLTNGRDAGDLDWSAIGGTWGVATSRLADWQANQGYFESKVLDSALDQIAHEDNKNGELLANYVARYFEDMGSHFHGLTPVLAHGAEVHYIVGNSAFYGVLLPVEKIYTEMLRQLGFTEVGCKAIRKRNSKKELIEFDVTAFWP